MRSVLDALRHRAAARPSALALRSAHADLSYGGLLERALAISEVIRRRGIRVLALAADNGPEWVAVDFAAQLAGAVLVPLPAFFSPDQIKHVITDSGAQAVVVDAVGGRGFPHAALDRMEPIGAELEIAMIRGAVRIHELPAHTAKISYTSGTTGRPKGVCLSQPAMDRVAHSLCVATQELRIGRHLCVLPLATLLENIAGIYAPLLQGAEIVLPRMPDVGYEGAAALKVSGLLRALRAHAPQSVILLPQMLAGVVVALEQGAPRPASLRFAAVGGGFVAASLLERAERLDLPIFEGYGLTECASVIALNAPGARRLGSVGRPLPHAAIRIGADAEIFVSGAPMAGYLGATSHAAAEIATGDTGHFDDDGFLYIDGRSKNIFITSFGRNVSPDWVEAELKQSRQIGQAALFGEARPWNVAVVVPASGRHDPADIQAAVDAANTRLPDYARIHRWLTAEPFTPANGLLTDNGRNRRAAIWRRYRERIDACYDGHVRRLA
ncbi:MAG TPA: AMP-binding protein [Gammaproteobacteria bacterium]|jgi:long-subunit acyl-CoA synthetase (AMP-forming)